MGYDEPTPGAVLSGVILAIIMAILLIIYIAAPV